MPLLLQTLGYRASFAVLAIVVALPIVLLVPAIRAIDRRLAPPEHLELIRTVSIFRPLSPAALDQVARSLTTSHAAAGEAIVREGDTSELFYLIRSGQVVVTQASRTLRRQGAGEFFGEIGLLRDVPRTATVTADSDVDLLVLRRDDFLNTVGGNPGSAAAVEDVVSNRLRA